MRGVQMRELREAAGLTQADLAGLLDVAKDTVARWERGERPILRVTELAVRQVLSAPGTPAQAGRPARRRSRRAGTAGQP